MHVLRKLGVAVLWLFLVNTLFLLAVVWTVNATFGNRNVVKNWFSESGVYNGIVDSVVRETEKGISESGESDGQNIDTEALSSAASNTFTPDVLRTSVEKVLDGTYDWLDGTTPNLAFSIDLSEQKAAFADNVVNEARARLATLPECGPAELQTTDVTDPFSLTCRPPSGVDEQLANFRSEFLSSEDFFSDPVLNADDLKVDSESGEQSIDQALPDAPKWYQQAKGLSIVLIVLNVLLAVGIVFLSARKRTGVRHVANGLIMVALFVLVAGFLVSRVADLISGDDGSIQVAVAKPLVTELGSDFSSYYYKFAAIYALLAVAGYVMVLLSKNRGKQHETNQTSTPPPPASTDLPQDPNLDTTISPDANEQAVESEQEKKN